jgi:hypothetical protein
MKFLNGWKTIIGTVVSVGAVLVSAGGDLGKVAAKAVEIVGHADAIVVGAGALLAALGLVHKGEKRTAK